MTQNEEILLELKRLNKNLEKNNNHVKLSWTSFLNGTFYALGAIFGTLIIASALIYLFSRFNFTASLSKWIESTMSQVNWTKIVSPQKVTIQEKTIETNQP